MLEEKFTYEKIIRGYPAIRLKSGRWYAFEWDGSCINRQPMFEEELKKYIADNLWR